MGRSCWLLASYLYFVWAVVFESDGVSLTLAWCGKTRHGGGSSSRGPPATEASGYLIILGRPRGTVTARACSSLPARSFPLKNGHK